MNRRPQSAFRSILRAGLFLAGAGVLAIAVLWWILPDPAMLKAANPQTTSFIEQKCTEAPCRIRWTPLSDMASFVPEAVLLAEDAQFMRHRGIDWRSIWSAAKANLRKGTVVWGGSSITMQLAKNLYLGPEKTPWRKLREMLLALKLERALSKERILELYLNVAEWGPGVFGIGNAAQFYFHKRADELGLDEAAFLASILPNPELVQHGKIPERFVEAGSRIFTRLMDFYLRRP